MRYKVHVRWRGGPVESSWERPHAARRSSSVVMPIQSAVYREWSRMIEKSAILRHFQVVTAPGEEMFSNATHACAVGGWKVRTHPRTRFSMWKSAHETCACVSSFLESYEFLSELFVYQTGFRSGSPYLCTKPEEFNAATQSLVCNLSL